MRSLSIRHVVSLPLLLRFSSITYYPMSTCRKRIVTDDTGRLAGSPPSPQTIRDTTSPLSPISPWPPLLTDDADTAPQETSHHGLQTLSPTSASNLPTSKEIYGSIAVLSTAIVFLVYLFWAFLPPQALDRVGWTWYPSRDWALIVPCWLMLVVLVTYLSYAGVTAYLTPPFDAPNLITDSHSHIPALDPGGQRYYWSHVGQGTMPPPIDLPIDLVNRVLYPPRPRQRSRVAALE